MRDMKEGRKQKPEWKIGKLCVLLVLALMRPLKEKIIQMTGKSHLDKYCEY